MERQRKHQFILEAWTRLNGGDPEKNLLADDFVSWLEEKGFFIGTSVMGDDEANLWAEIHGLRAIPKNHGEVNNGRT